MGVDVPWMPTNTSGVVIPETSIWFLLGLKIFWALAEKKTFRQMNINKNKNNITL